MKSFVKKQETRSLKQKLENLERPEVGVLPGEGLNEVPGEAQDPQELRTFGGLNEVRREAHVPRELRAIEEETGGGLNEVLREASDHRELRAVHCAQQVLVCPKR